MVHIFNVLNKIRANKGSMGKEKINILVCGLVKTGSSALVDMLSEYDNINVIPGEFDDFRAPGLVADQLSYEQSVGFRNKIERLIGFKTKFRIVVNIFLPIFMFRIRTIRGIKYRFVNATIRINQLILLRRLNNKLNSEITFNDKIKYANNWITQIGNINNKKKEFVVFNQPLTPSIDTKIWEAVFHPWKLICVYRSPRDQMSDIIKYEYLYAPYGAPFMNFGGVILEDLYGRNREGAIKFHIDALKMRLQWIDTLKQKFGPDKFLLIDFEGFVNNYDTYKTVIENFIGNLKGHHRKSKKYFDPQKAKKNIDIYSEYLSSSELESLEELQNCYDKMIKSNQNNFNFKNSLIQK